jgi:hypothetical protein
MYARTLYFAPREALKPQEQVMYPNNSCCPWKEFAADLRDYWKCKTPINWQRAYAAWRKYSATPGEFANGCLREERLAAQVTVPQAQEPR